MGYPSSNLFSPLMKRVRGRAETGRWLRAMPTHRIRDLLDPYSESVRGGRMNPPGSFPVLYAVADDEGCLPMLGVPEDEPETVIAVFSVSLVRVLDLTDPGTRRKLGITVADLSSADEPGISRSIGIAAYNEGFEGVIYPRPLNPRCRNLAIFSDRITSGNIQLLELRTPGLPSKSADN
jgi:RES domain-containing protein